jgi:formate dehydrogenase major subunit
VTAVQVSRVSQLSEWQRNYQAFSEEQISFVGKNPESSEV